MNENVMIVQEKNGKTFLQRAAVVGSAVVVIGTANSNAAAGALDMADATTTLVLALAAIGALGAAKIAPAALTWVWSIVTGMAKRG